MKSNPDSNRLTPESTVGTRRPSALPCLRAAAITLSVAAVNLRLSNSPGMPSEQLRSKWPIHRQSTPSSAAIAAALRTPSAVSIWAKSWVRRFAAASFSMEKLAAANRRTQLFAQIETAEGVRNAAAIAALDGVDCLWIGHFDLSCSLGIPGEFDNRKFTAATDKVIAAARKHGKALGRLVPTVDSGVSLFESGFDFICYSGDVWALQSAVAGAVTALRERCPAPV